MPPLTTTLKIAEAAGGFDLHVTERRCCHDHGEAMAAGGFDLHVTVAGYDGVPFQIACDFVPGGELDFDSGIVRGQAGEVAFLKDGYATYHLGNDAISIGPGAYAHRFWQMRGSESAPTAFRVLLTFVTPVDRVLKIRCGTWSATEEKVV